MSANKIGRALQELKDDRELLRHRPGTAGHDLAAWLICERKRDEAAARAKKQLKKAADEIEAEAAALHAVRTAHGLVKSVHAQVPKPESKSSRAGIGVHRAQLAKRASYRGQVERRPFTGTGQAVQ
jgi:hypothetical protein